MIAPKKDEDKRSSTQRGRTGAQKPWRAWALIVGVVATVATGVSLCFLGPDTGDTHKAGQATPSQIAEVKPTLPAPVEAATISPEIPAKKQGPALDYARLAAEGKTVVTNKAGEEIVLARSRRRERPRPAYAIFKHESENKIAALITMEPGRPVFGTQIYNEKFVDDFMKSCESPIVIEDSDDEYARRLKQDMIETKIELRERMREGENICDIMSDTRKELQRLGMVKKNIERMMVDELKTSAKDAYDVDDLVDAANALLEAQGIAPLKLNPVLKRSIMRTIESNPLEDTEK